MTPDSSRRSACSPSSSSASSRAAAVGGDVLEVGRVEPAQPVPISSTSRSGRDEPDDPGSALRSARSRSN